MTLAYDGPALVLETDGDPIPVEVRLRSGFQPIDGHVHWWGRIAPSSALAAAHRSGDHVRLRVDRDELDARISDVDPWGRFRVTGSTGRGHA